MGGMGAVQFSPSFSALPTCNLGLEAVVTQLKTSRRHIFTCSCQLSWINRSYPISKPESWRKISTSETFGNFSLSFCLSFKLPKLETKRRQYFLSCCGQIQGSTLIIFAIRTSFYILKYYWNSEKKKNDSLAGFQEINAYCVRSEKKGRKISHSIR